MSVFSKIIGSGISTGISTAIGSTVGTITSPIEAVGNVFDKLFTSDDEKAKAAFVLQKLKQEPHLLQAEINKIEAAHASVFVAGWRPAIGWVCAISLFTYYVPKHLMATTLWVRSSWAMQELMSYPIGTDGLMELVFALLGLGLFRSAEKLGAKR